VVHTDDSSKIPEECCPKEGLVIGLNRGLVLVSGMTDSSLGCRVEIGENEAVGEILAHLEEGALVSVYDETSDLLTGSKVKTFQEPIFIPLGPGLDGRRFDALLRPLNASVTPTKTSPSNDSIDLNKTWYFAPQVLVGDQVSPGLILGDAKNGGSIRYKVMSPPGITGTIQRVHSGERTAGGNLVVLKEGQSISMLNHWPLRTPRPILSRLALGDPTYTICHHSCSLREGGMIEAQGLLFPQRMEAVASLLGQHAFDAVVIVCCGLPIAQVAEYIDAIESLGGGASTPFPKTIWVIAPPSITQNQVQLAPFTGMRLAEFFRDMGHSVLLVMDDLARWNLLRKQMDRLTTGRYPFRSLARDLFSCSGRVECLGGLNRIGAISLLAFHSNLSE